MALATVLPLQLCEHVSVTVASALQQSGASAGTAFAFLLSAPATNIPTLMVLSRGAASAVARMSAALVVAPLALSFLVDAAGMDMHVGTEIDELFHLPAWYTRGGALAIAAVLLAVHYAGSCLKARGPAEAARARGKKVD